MLTNMCASTVRFSVEQLRDLRHNKNSFYLRFVMPAAMGGKGARKFALHLKMFRVTLGDSNQRFQ